MLLRLALWAISEINFPVFFVLKALSQWNQSGVCLPTTIAAQDKWTQVKTTQWTLQQR